MTFFTFHLFVDPQKNTLTIQYIGIFVRHCIRDTYIHLHLLYTKYLCTYLAIGIPHREENIDYIIIIFILYS